MGILTKQNDAPIVATKKYCTLITPIKTLFLCPMQCRIEENSWIARLAAKRLKRKKLAVVFGNTIFLHNYTKAEFINNPLLLRHELVHVRQYSQYGVIRFLFFYLVEGVKNGYHNNKFEIEAEAVNKTKALGRNVTLRCK
jgi:hypothetical protein